METLRCNNTDLHNFHIFIKEVTRNCSGKTSCSFAVHEPHTYYRIEDFFCPGICDCGLRSETHGPGAHK